MIGIGISTYNDFVNTNKLINSIKKYTPGNDYVIAVVDDGTENERTVNALKKICASHDAVFSHNPVNRGIPYTWNRLTELCAPEPEDIAVLFNNDIIVTDKNWLRCIEYFLTENEKIGTVGYPLIYPDDQDRTEKERSWGEIPGHVGASVGCCFGFRKKVWQQVTNPDGSTGFWEDLVSFHEEIHFGFVLSSLGYYNFMLPFPPMVHKGGETFDKNRELTDRAVDWSKWDKQEYIELIKNSTVYPDEWKKDKIAWSNEKGDDLVDRMAFSRYMFAKHWDVLHEEYLFKWDDFPGNGSKNGIDILKSVYHNLDWIASAKIEKIDDGRIIKLTAEEKSDKEKYLLLSLNDEKTRVALKFNDGRSTYLVAKCENGKLNIYLRNYYDAPQVSVHKMVVTPMPKRMVKWLDQDLKEREAEV